MPGVYLLVFCHPYKESTLPGSSSLSEHFEVGQQFGDSKLTIFLIEEERWIQLLEEVM